MFFTRIGKVLAHLIFWLSAFKLVVGLSVAFGTTNTADNRFWARRYLMEESSGEAVDKATLYILVAVALGILCEISSKIIGAGNRT